MKRRPGTSLLELVMVMGLLAAVIVPALTLSRRNARVHQDVLERTLAQGLCLDVMERLERYKLPWALPGEKDGPPLAELYTPVELRPGWATLFDRVYLDQLKALGMDPRPEITRTPAEGRYGLFLLEVRVAWTGARGHAREVAVRRWCYAP